MKCEIAYGCPCHEGFQIDALCWDDRSKPVIARYEALPNRDILMQNMIERCSEIQQIRPITHAVEIDQRDDLILKEDVAVMDVAMNWPPYSVILPKLCGNAAKHI